MFFPISRKFKKSKKLISRGSEFKTTVLKFGDFGLKAIGCGRITSKQIETARQAIKRKIKPAGKVYIRLFAHIPVSSIPSKVRMGKGKGNLNYWGCGVKNGQILYEVSGVNVKKAFSALRIGALKLPIRTKIITRDSCGLIV